MKYNVQNLAFLSAVIAFASCQQHKESTIDEAGNEVIKIRKPTEDTIVESPQTEQAPASVPTADEPLKNQPAKMVTPREPASAQTSNSADTGKPAPMITVKGIVREITRGKDGYTAKIETSGGDVVAATVSRSNLRDPDQYRELAVGDAVRVSGNTWKLDGVGQMTVRALE